MPNDSVTLALEGDSIPFHDFAVAVQNFDALVRALTNDLVREAPVEWLTDDLQIGSAIMTQRAESSDLRSIERIVEAFPEVGRDVHSNFSRFPPSVMMPARRISNLINGHVTAARFQTPSDEYRVTARPEQRTAPLVAIGAVEGHVETLARRGSLRFTLYDLKHERPVYCYALQEQEALLRGIWGMHVIVRGTIYRSPDTGRPHTVRHIRAIDVIPEVETDHYRKALG